VKIIESNARFDLSGHFEVHLDHVKVPARNDRMAEKTNGRSLVVMSATKMSIVVVKAAFFCLVLAIKIAVTQGNGHP